MNWWSDDTGGADILTFYDARRYTLATAFTLAYPYGFTRIMSSYAWNGGPDRSITITRFIGLFQHSSYFSATVDLDSTILTTLRDFCCRQQSSLGSLWRLRSQPPSAAPSIVNCVDTIWCRPMHAGFLIDFTPKVPKTWLVDPMPAKLLTDWLSFRRLSSASLDASGASPTW